MGVKIFSPFWAITFLAFLFGCSSDSSPTQIIENNNIIVEDDSSSDSMNSELTQSSSSFANGSSNTESSSQSADLTSSEASAGPGASSDSQPFENLSSADNSYSSSEAAPQSSTQPESSQAVITSAPSVTPAASGKVNFPFPQNASYGNGIQLSDKTNAASQLKAAFSYYLSNKYKENENYAAIEKDENSNTFVSEGIGYGMLMMVYFSDNETSYQSQFDKLWAFYKAGENVNGLMNWAFGNLQPYNNNANAATDAEMDVAAALIMAAYQFGDNKYLDDAKTLLKNVRLYEFEESGLHKPGDAWNDKKNPSYIAPAYYRLFAAVDTDNATFWNTKAMNANYALLEANSAEYSTGLFDNWSDASGKGLDSYYGYDAARTPWRLAQDFYWFGEKKAETMLSKLGAWVSSKPASSMSGTIHRSGDPIWGDHNSTFVATLMTSLVTESSRQTKLDEYWNESVTLGNEAYFEQSMKILCGLLVSGNMPNLMALSN